MEQKPGNPKRPKPDRAARLKAALKSNLGRRKAQARARAADGADASDGSDGTAASQPAAPGKDS